MDARRTRNLSPAEIHPVARFPEDWIDVLSTERPFRAGQIFRWIHERGVFDPNQMTDLSKGLREQLIESGLSEPFQVAELQRSQDGTRKLLLHLQDGNPVECVLIPMTNNEAPETSLDTDDESADGQEFADEDESEAERAVPRSKRVTLCISTQVGCAMACSFCASGRAGLRRGLGAAEIVAQVLFAKRYLDPGEHLRNLVFMGMGEPLHHYDETARAIRLLTHPKGLGMSPRKITVSTVGLIPGIKRLGDDFGGKVGLAVSLHAPDNETRDRIMPMNRRFPLEELIAELRRYPLPPHRRLTIEYTLIRGVNDSVAHAERLVGVVQGLRCKVNLIPMNPVAGSGLETPSDAAVDAFYRVLCRRRVACTVRKRRGDDVDAACGQLAFKGDLVQLRKAPASQAADGTAPDRTADASGISAAEDMAGGN